MGITDVIGLNQNLQSGGLTVNPYQLQPQPGLTQGAGLGYYGTSDVYKPAQIGTQILGTTAPTGAGGGTAPVSQPSQPSGPSAPDELTTQLDAIFNPVFSALQGQENTLQQNYAPVEGQIQAQGALSQESLLNQKNQGMGELGTQEKQAGARKEDALTSATRLYNELQRGGQQRFGGASSAGEAYQTLTATEQQRRQGSIYGAYETAMQQVGQYKANLQDKYATAVKEVDLQVQQAKADAQAQFRDALQTIQSAKFQAQSDKATASMNALQDLRNKIYTVNLQALQFTQQLALNHEATLKQVDQYTQQAIQSVTGAQQTTSAFGTQAQTLADSTKYGIGAPQQTATPLQTGQISPVKRPEDLYGLA